MYIYSYLYIIITMMLLLFLVSPWWDFMPYMSYHPRRRRLRYLAVAAPRSASESAAQRGAHSGGFGPLDGAAQKQPPSDAPRLSLD